MGFKGWKEEDTFDKLMDWLGAGTEEGRTGKAKEGEHETSEGKDGCDEAQGLAFKQAIIIHLT